MKRSLLWLTVVATFLATLSMSAENAKVREASARLKGDFAFVSTEHCLHAAGFGPPPLLQPIGAMYHESSTIQGIVTFNGAGGGAIAGRVASLTTMVAATPSYQAELRCSISYGLRDDSTFQMERRCKATARRGAGSVGVQTIEFGPVRVNGHLHGNTITAADTELAVETVTSFWGAKTPTLCHRNWTASKVERLGR